MRMTPAVLLLALCAGPSAARAQLPDPPRAPSDEDVAHARELFVQGVGHAEQNAWDEALDAFVRSYAASGSPVALYNVASTLRELGRYRDARDAFDRLLAEPALDDETRMSATRLRTEVAARVARVTVERVPPGEARVRSGAEVRETTERPIELELDPGPREIGVELPAHEPWRWSGSLAPGAVLVLDASLAPVGRDDPLPWILGAVGAVLAGVVLTIVVADVEAQLDPRTPLVIALP